MATHSLRNTIAVLALGFVALGGSLASSAASAKEFPGGGHSGLHGVLHPIRGGFGGDWGRGRGRDWGHGRDWRFGGYRDFGYRHVGLREFGGCVVTRSFDMDGNIVLRKVCY